MGAAHSQPASRLDPRLDTQGQPVSTSEPPIIPPRSSRLSSLTRLPSFARHHSKRGRPLGSPPGTESKRLRSGTASNTPDVSSTTSLPSSLLPSSSTSPSSLTSTSDNTAGPSRITLDDLTRPSPLEALGLGPPTLPPIDPVSPLSSPRTSHSPMNDDDPLRLERVQSIATIREVLGPEWPAPSSITPGVEALVNRLRSNSSTGSSNPIQSAMPSTTSEPRRSMGSRLSSWLGRTGDRPAVDPEVILNPVPTPEATTQAIDDLYRQLEAAREEFAETGRQMEELRQSISQQEQFTESLLAQEAATRRAQQAPTRTIPAGAVLVIQGLAQTHTLPDQDVEDGNDNDGRAGEHSSPGSRGIGRSRSVPQRESRSRGDGEEEGISLETQARRIGSLLTVAAAATATTLLSPPSARPTRSTATSALESIMNRFRPSRLSRSSQSTEAALGEYLRQVLRDNRRLDQSPSEASTESDVIVSNEFQSFLESLQTDLVDAVREFAGPTERVVEGDVGMDTATSDLAESVATGSSTPNQFATAPTTPVLASAAEPAVPTFHPQPGQIIAPTTSGRRTAVSGGGDEPRTLNFFRAHLFPALRTSTSTAASPSEDPTDMIPSIFIGVRSLRHDPSMTTDEIVQHPAFPFHDGVVPSNNAPVESPSLPENIPSSPPQPSQTPAPPSPTPEPRRTLRRVLNRLSLRRETPPFQGPLNTYLVYVIGGNYPRSHPILAIPHLITGEPLTDEEMALIGEMMGIVKPPTVSQEDIEKSDLKVVSGSEMGKLGMAGEILSNSIEACAICLSDYEAEDQCRILHCRHAFHKECVDHWLSQGRNSCPSCRSEAVAGAPTPNITPSAPTVPGPPVTSVIGDSDGMDGLS